jgi:hypothetical protein
MKWDADCIASKLCRKLLAYAKSSAIPLDDTPRTPPYAVSHPLIPALKDLSLIKLQTPRSHNH